MHEEDTYARLSRAIAGRRLPLAVVDLDALGRNTDALLGVARAHGKRLRLATKSVRVTALIQRLLRAGAQGLMCFTAREALHLWRTHGLDDLLLAYPTLEPSDLDDLATIAAGGGVVSLVVDSPAHVAAASARAAAAGTTLPLVLELDVAYRPLGARLGALRSPIASVEDALALARRIAATPHVRFHGVMAYEAHVAGLPDRGRTRRWQNPLKRGLKLAARAPLEHSRRALVDALVAAGLPPTVVNGGGTGNLPWCAAEPTLTEVTAGSGFLCSHLFDGYRDVSLRPALAFALPVVRAPAPGVVTALGGGYVGSGEAGPDKLPLPWLPAGLRLTAMEAAGEVQTPLVLPPGASLAPGAPVFLRPAKAGELAERFTHYLLVEGDRVVDEVPTYRGEGHAFL